MDLSTGYVLCRGAFEPAKAAVNAQDHQGSLQELKERALSPYNLVRVQDPEQLVSGSDDFTLFLWSPAEDKKPLAQMMGHQALIDQVLFSSDSCVVTRDSFNRSIKLWDGRTGKFQASLHSHVSAMYQIAAPGQRQH